MFEVLPDLPYLLLAVPVVYYLGLPLLIRAQQWMKARPEKEPLDLKRVDRDFAEFLMTQAADLFALGFDEPEHVRIKNPVPNVTNYLILLINRDTGDKAMVTVIRATGAADIRATYVEFSTRFESGEVFVSYNTGQLNAFPPAPQATRTQVPGVRDPAELYALHQYLMERAGVAGNKVVFPPAGRSTT